MKINKTLIAVLIGCTLFASNANANIDENTQRCIELALKASDEHVQATEAIINDTLTFPEYLVENCLADIFNGGLIPMWSPPSLSDIIGQILDAGCKALRETTQAAADVVTGKVFGAIDDLTAGIGGDIQLGDTGITIGNLGHLSRASVNEVRKDNFWSKRYGGTAKALTGDVKKQVRSKAFRSLFNKE